MRVAIIGDTHIGKTLYGFDLTESIRTAMYSFFRFCVEQKVGTAVHLGDLFDKPRPSLENQKVAIQWANEFERAGINLIILTGNHDCIAGPAGLSALDVIRSFPYQFVRVVDRPLMVKSDLPSTSHFLFLPFSPPGIFDSQKDWRAAIKKELKEAKPESFVAFAHLDVEGAAYGDQEFLYRGKDYAVPKGLLAHNALSLVVCGHVHKPQLVQQKVQILGAAQRFRFDESTNQPRFMVFDNPHHTRTRFIDSINLFELELDASGFSHAGKPPNTGALLQAIKHMDFEGYFVKILPFIDEHTAIAWHDIEAFIYERGAKLVVLGSPSFVGGKERVTVTAKKVVRQPTDAAKAFIKAKVGNKEDRRAIFKRFKRLQERTDAKE